MRKKNDATESYQLKDNSCINLVEMKLRNLVRDIPVEQLFPRPLGDDRDDKRGCIEGG